jgi:iron complex outermembrane receptor protein
MQSVFHQQPKLRLSLIALACQLACVSLSANAQTAPDAAMAPKAEVVITGKKLGMGLMVTEDAPKARSTITAEELEKQRPTGNAYEALEMLPSVNSYNYDATGLFGGGMSLRGFNSDQIGATINGVPVNDSGNFAVYPQEYVDQENTCSQTVTQGSTDVDSPQVGASGGNFNIVTCNPENTQRVRIMQSIGQLAMHKTFVRYDTGLFADQRSKAFISYSNAEADKWKGTGKAKREHVDAGFNYDWDRFNYVHATLLYNEAKNNSINNLTLAEIKANGYYYDTSAVFAGHVTPVKGTAQTDVAATPPYYGLFNNPFKNAIFSATAKFRLGADTDVKIVPYYWFGFGNGGIQQRLYRESYLSTDSSSGFLNRATNTRTAAVDLNGDGDTLDRVVVANASVTRTQRPGVTASLTHTIGNHELLGGFWYEKATHRQTGPMVAVDANGNYDWYLQDKQFVRPDGTPFESRDNRTISTAYQAFVQDTVSMLDDKALINIGFRTPSIKRDFTNYASEGSQVATYQIDRTYKKVLPQFGARYKITNDDQVFISVAKNMKAPPNFVFSNVGTNVKIINGAPVLSGDVKEETSWNTDIGYRHQDSRYIATLTAFGVNFKDRQATAFDPLAQASIYTNVGDVKTKGFEIEANNMPINGWSLYGSVGYLRTEIQNDLRLAAATATLSGVLPTAGKQLPNSPRLKGGLSIEYAQDAFWARVKAKATSEQQSTLVNDEKAPGYTTFGFDAGYTFANYGLLKRPKLTLNASNITDKQYRNGSSTAITNTNPVAGAVTSTSALRYYLGAPRFVSLTLSVDI